MAHFRGTLQGAHGEASRLGTKSSGLTVEAQSWQGKVVVTLTERDGVDYATVHLTQHLGCGAFPLVVLYDGPVSGAPEVTP